MTFNPGTTFGVTEDRMFIRNTNPLTLLAYVTRGQDGLEWSAQVLCGELAGAPSVIPELAVNDHGLNAFFVQGMQELLEQAAAANRQDISWDDRVASIGITHMRTYNNYRGDIYELRMSLTRNPCISSDNYAAQGLRAGAIVGINVAGVLMIRLPRGLCLHALAQHLCSMCNAPDSSQRCSRCHFVRYCSRVCQRRHWATHRYVCDAVNDIRRSVNALDRTTENA